MPEIYVQGYRPMLEPLTGSEMATKYGAEAISNINLLVQQVKNLELCNAELESALAQSQRSDLDAKIRRHIGKYQAKRDKAQADRDLMAQAAADQRIRALEALFDN
ncbi:hypothetical protein [Nonomuraea jabiensis]|uniref:hypothetical protein n=1 Tax=Nonomuraea jabiensis TaxID=882448 RepID=UPI003D73AA85